MSSKHGNTAIGAFVAGAVVLTVVSLLYFSGSSWVRDADTVVMVFDGSIKGLTIGAPVTFRGVQIGQVTDIDLVLDTESADINLLVKAQITGENITYRGDDDQPLINDLIARGMRAQLNTQSLLTGLLFIQWDYYPETELVLADIDSPYVQVPTIPSDLQRIAQEIEAVDIPSLAADLHSAIRGLDTFVSNPDFQGLAGELRATLLTLQDLSGNLDRQLTEVGPGLAALITTADTATASLNEEIPRLADSMQASLHELNGAVTRFAATMENIDYAVSEDSPTVHNLNTAIRELATAGRAFSALADTLQAQPEALLRGRNEDTP